MLQPKIDRKVVSIAERLMPSSIDAEESVAGGVLIDPNAIARIADMLPVEAFYFTPCASIYRAAQSLHATDRACDLTTICTYLTDHDLLESIGGVSTILELVDGTVSAVNIDGHAQIVLDKWRRRQIIQHCQSIIATAQDGATAWSEIHLSAQEKIFSLSDSASQSPLRSIGDLLAEEWLAIEQPEVYGFAVQSGFYDLDAMTQGFRPGQLIVIGGRPAMGKSAFAGVLAVNAAAKGQTVAIFSMEMKGGIIARRFMAAQSQIELPRLVAGRLSDAEWEPLNESIVHLSQLPVYINDDETLTPNTVLSHCRKLKAQSGLHLVVVDYLHLMLDGSDDEVRELSKITRAFKKLARKLDCPIVLLSQLSRAVESRTNKRPMLSDLRQGGSIEQDADLVIFLYRDEYYNPDTPDRGIAEVIVSKNRNGPTGTAKLLFEPHFSRFRNLKR